MDLTNEDLNRISVALGNQWNIIDGHLNKLAEIGAEHAFASMHEEGIEIRRLLRRMDQELHDRARQEA